MAIEKGSSCFNVLWLTAMGVHRAHAPHTTIRLKILDPTTLLTASSLLPAMDAVTLTAHSGRDVPMATMVIPITMAGM